MLICDHMILISSASTTYLYEFPEPTHSVAESHSHIIPLKYLASDEGEGGASQPKIWNSLCKHHEGRISFVKDRGNRFQTQVDLIMLPPARSEAGASVSNEIMYGYTMGFTRVLWYEEMEDLRLFSRVHTTKPNKHMGYARLGRNSAHDPKDQTTISISGYPSQRSVRNITWDEESGRICLLTEEYVGHEVILRLAMIYLI